MRLDVDLVSARADVIEASDIVGKAAQLARQREMIDDGEVRFR